ncbi:MAG TPA: hypothetical protein VGM88_06610 [Kofleriaceae bacterium]
MGVLAATACGSNDGPSYPQNHPRIYLSQNGDALKTALTANGPAAKKWLASTDRWVSGSDVYNFDPWNAALAGQLTGDAKYCMAAVTATDAIVSGEQSKIDGGSDPDVASDDYLDIGQVVGNIALVYDWCYGSIPGDRREAWITFASQAVANVWDPMHAKWGDRDATWAGWAIDDPSDNYYYSFLRATMLLGLAAHDEYSQGTQWLDEFRTTKLGAELVPEFNTDLVGGGSREGTGYGVSQKELFELYDFWAASTGEDIASLTDQTRMSIRAMMHQTLPTLDRVAPTGDQSRDSTASFFDYHRQYLEELVSLYPDDNLSPRAMQLLADSSIPAMTQGFEQAFDFLYANAGVTPQALDGMGTAYFAPGIGQLYARSSWDKTATWMNFTAGPYTQSHAHQDQGAILFYKDGWLAYDPVIDSHSGLPQDAKYHSTVRIVSGGNDVKQKLMSMSTMSALHTGDGFVYAAGDLTPAYGSSVTKFQREVVYVEPDCLVVYDRVASAADTQQVWQLAMPQAPTVNGAMATESAAGHTLTIQRVAPAAATPSVYSFSAESDFAAGSRLDETMTGGDNRFLHVIWIDGAVGTVTPMGDDGVQLMLDGGATFTVAFDHDDIGATINGTALGAGVDQLPE